MDTYPYTEYTLPTGHLCMGFLHGSFRRDCYEDTAKEAIKHGVIMFRVIDTDGTEFYRRTVVDA